MGDSFVMAHIVVESQIIRRWVVHTSSWEMVTQPGTTI